MNKNSFTIIEFLIALAIVVFLVGIIFIQLKPIDYFKNIRDDKRISDLNNLETILNILLLEDKNLESGLSTTTVYVSLPDNSPTCSSWISQLPTLPPSWQYKCSATPYLVNGQGWIPIDFTTSSRNKIIKLKNLPIDPINKPPYYYSYITGGSYTLYAQLENLQSQASKNDGDNYPHLYSVGTNKRLIDQVQGLVGYWSFDDCTAKDLSGNENNGTLVNGPTCVDGKVGKALSFDGVDDYVNVPDNSMLILTGNLTILLWMNKTSEANDWQRLIGKGNSNHRNYGLWEENVSGQRILFQQYGGGCGNLFSNSKLATGTWYLVGAIRSENNGFIYINGNKDSSGSCWGTPYTSNDPLTFAYAGFHTFYPGFIDEIRIYNRALSDAEIKALYEATK
ncbi:MAG: hypothetical protein KatS3mg095_0809 [Candidatus Parcubacteria bacterium]|nr:MAG: hypothetical protein KatS3mg095_0809 [Candidatus Parcubacteria bacterium]